MNLEHAQNLADRLVMLLRPACVTIRVAGSVRRGRPDVKDIELVAQPMLKRAQTLFGAEGEWTSLLDLRLQQAIDGCPLLQRGDKDGDRYKRLVFEGQPVDLFVVRPPATFGAILAIRTGPAEFSRLCVTQRALGGAMPQGMRQHEGQLFRGGVALETPTEESWFAAIGLPQWPAHERSTVKLERYLATREKVR